MNGRKHGQQFKVGGFSFKDFIEQQKLDHIEALEAEKQAREKAKKETLLQETRYGAKPSTPARLKGLNNTKTPRKGPVTPSASRILSKVSSAVASIRSPRAGRVAKGTSPRVGGKPQSKNKKAVAASEAKIKKGVLTEKNNYTLVGNDTVIQSHKGGNLSVSSNVPDYANFKKGTMLNSTEAITPEVISHKRRTPSYMTPTQSASNKMFKTPSTPATGSRSRLMTTPNRKTSTSSLRSGKNMPFLF